MIRACLGLGCVLTLAVCSSAAEPPVTLPSPFAAVDLNVGETADVALPDGQKVAVKLLKLDERRDKPRGAVRAAHVTVEVGGRSVELVSANYRLPVTVGNVQIDSPVAKGCIDGGRNVWALEKDVRLRLWPAGAAWIQPGTFRYPLDQRWFATDTQMANEPVFVDGGDAIGVKPVYYHWGLDFGGAEALVDVTAATDGTVVAAGMAVTKAFALPSGVNPRGDVVYLRDARGWFYRYSHLNRIDPALKPDEAVKIGQKVGLLGKEGGSGGWSHLHFDIVAPQPSGKYGIVEAYAFVWQAYCNQFQPKLIAVARPHSFVGVGETATLDASRSWSAGGQPIQFEWTLGDGTKATGPSVARKYDRPGVYSEVLRATDGQGNVAYDFAKVHVLDPANPKQRPPSIHAVYYPTHGIRAGDELTFKVRSFRVRPDEGRETWDFGDGSSAQTTQSDGCQKTLAADGYAIIRHRYTQPGQYLVRVERKNDRGEPAITHLWVTVSSH